MKEQTSSKKYGKILATARDLFWKHGFKRISIEELCEQAQVSKMTFYKFFPNKIELAKAVFDCEVQGGLKAFKEIVTENTPATEKIRRIVEMKAKGTNNISKEFLHDFYSDRQLGLKEYVDKRTRDAWTEILNDFRRAQQMGSFRSNMKPELLFFISQKLGELITDENLLKLYSSPQDLVLELTNLMAYGISPSGDQTT
jgi:AcrR family transcriptional regulator